MTKVRAPARSRQFSKRTELIESEGRILRLDFDPEAPPGAAAASIRIFAEISAVTLDSADITRVRKALAARAARGNA